MATSKAMPTQHVSSAAAASETEFFIRSELENVGPERSRLHSKKSKMQHPWHIQQQQMSHLPEDDDFEVTPGGASSASAGVVFGGGPLAPPIPRFGTAARATQAFLARESQSPGPSSAAAAPVVGESADLWANFRARQREASRRPRSPDHPPPNRPARPAPVPPSRAADSVPPPANVPPPAGQRLSRIYDIDDGVHDVPQGHDAIFFEILSDYHLSANAKLNFAQLSDHQDGFYRQGRLALLGTSSVI